MKPAKDGNTAWRCGTGLPEPRRLSRARQRAATQGHPGYALYMYLMFGL
jgi:hypothetical protein